MDQFYYITTLIIFGVLGVCIGSFLNVVIYRVPLGMSLSFPSSHCPNCKHKIKWYDNIPLLSYIILGGKCRYCKKPISMRYFMVELSNCLLWLLCVLQFYDKGIFYCALSAIFLSLLLVVAFCDADNMFIPDRFQIMLAVVGILSIVDNPSLWQDKLIGACFGGGFFLFFYLLSFLLFKREGLGFGDVKLMTVVGLFIGWKNILISIFISVFIAFFYVIISKIANINRKQSLYDNSGEFAFAPFLVIGSILSLFLGEFLINSYISLLL